MAGFIRSIKRFISFALFALCAHFDTVLVRKGKVMKPFIDENFMLKSETAERFYYEYSEKHTERVLQFGEGNFLRGFVDWMFDRLNKENNGDYGVVVVQPLPGGRAESLNKQDGLYTLYLRGLLNGEKKEETRIVECVTRGIDPYSCTDEFFGCALNPELRYIISNTTEAGIEYRRGDEVFSETTFPGRLAMFLKARFDAGLKGFLILPCELIDNNGSYLKECVLRYADDWGYGESFRKWLEEENCFMNTLVDRIVTGYPKDTAARMEQMLGYRDELLDSAEIFHLWVIEGDKKYADELPFDKIGLNVVWTDDVTPYKKRKVRILNGAHTMLSPAAMLMGVETVREAMENSVIAEFVNKGIFDEIIPTIDMPDDELKTFAGDVLERFKNPFIDHYLSSIILNSVSKFRVRVLPSIKDYMSVYNDIPKCLVFSLAALLMFYKTGTPDDDKEVIEAIKKEPVSAVLKNISFWGEDLSFIGEQVERYIELTENNNTEYAMAIASGRI